ncbi:MAG TPA: polysaccharide deacetylase family protein [Bryobacteraceae bacterium]|nr:polysaccharide deacetylase family protein [Bryobacteraceae bacterium]
MRRKALVAAGVIVVAAAALFFFLRHPREDGALQSSLAGIVDDYRKIIVLMDGVENLDASTRAKCEVVGHALFWHKHQALDDLSAKFADSSAREARTQQLVRYLTEDRSLHDADKLAFLDLVSDLSGDVPAKSPHLSALRDNLQSIQLAYREEVTRIFSQFATRGATGTREKWDAYVADLRKRLSRESILGEYGDLNPEEPLSDTRGAAKSNEIWGTEFPAKSVALTFDDGPHPKYTEQVLAILRKYGIKGTFFEVGYVLGKPDATGKINLLKVSEVSKKIVEAGHTLANHSYSHPVLPKLSEAQRNTEIDETNSILEMISGRKTELFRAPYGARNQAIIQRVTSEGMKSIMWNTNGEDWADPIPESIAMRLLHQMNEQQKGIIVLHDIHQQSVLALSPVIEELMRQNYTFLSYKDGQFVKSDKPEGKDRAPGPVEVSPVSEAPRKLYRESWAVIIGVNDYQSWPKLRYAVNDANGIEDVLVNRFGFQRDHIRKLVNGDATRQRIMQVLGDELSDSRKVQREDRVFFFFAGHGATRTLEDGRQIGFIVPVDADKENYYSTAISMTALREAADLIPAKHVYFVMDSCYSGLAMTRGVNEFSKDRSYIEEVTRRAARQILTAGGAEQQVADDGPNGHSVFTWALLQGLEGQADLDGNGVITASELGAYVSPIVSSFAKQTPAVGNLLGSEGGEFIFELQPQPLSSGSKQLDSQSLQLTEQLANLQKQIAAKQEELLRLQQSIQAQSSKLTQVQVTRSAAAPHSPAVRAYDLDRQGQQFYREQKYDEAIQKMQEAVGLRPGDALLLNNLGYVYYAAGKYDQSMVYLQKTLAVDPHRKEAHLNIADLLMKLNRPSEAKPHYEEFLRLMPNSSRAEEVKKILQGIS